MTTPTISITSTMPTTSSRIAPDGVDTPGWMVDLAFIWPPS